jgi:hypothetical protein
MSLLEAQIRTEESPLYLKSPEAEVSDVEATIHAMQSLAVRVGSEIYYEAADPGYKSSFTRDSLISMSLRGDPEILESQVEYSALRLGKVQNPLTGEEPGKAHHELPSVTTENGLDTAYNGCDTTAELLRSIAVLAETGHSDVLDKYASVINESVEYIVRHVNTKGLFEEDPKYAGVTAEDGRERKFGLKVTDWKDSELNREGSRQPNYPIVYTLAHFQNAEALQRIGKVTDNEMLTDYASHMIAAGLEYLWAGDHFITAVDGDGIVDPPSSDSLHALLHISPSELPYDYAQKIEQYSKQLETPAGYRAGIPVTSDVDIYHMKVWTHEQALLHAAAKKHELYRSQEVARKITSFIFPQEDIFPELIDPGTLEPDGNICQLWAMGAYLYFQSPERALL